MKQYVRILTVVTFAVIMASAVYAIDGRIPIHESTAISSAGHYYLTRDINSTNDPVIDINSDNVTLDLNGHTISSSSTTNNVVDFNEYTNITIKNGRINGGGYGVYYYSTELNTKAIIENLQIDSTYNTGIYLFGVGKIKVKNCDVSNVTDGYGIFAWGYDALFTGKVENNVVYSTALNGIRICNSEGTSISNNNISNAGTIFSSPGMCIENNSGLSGGGNIIENNTVTNSVGIGIYIYDADSNLTRNNVCRNNAGDGIRFYYSDSNIIRNNICKDNTESGIYLSSSSSFANLIDNNQCEGNSGWGIDAGDTTNNYRNNMLLNNTSGAVSGGTDAGGNIL